MFSRRTLPVMIGLVLLSGMFLMGQDTWGPPVEGPYIASVLPDPAWAGAVVTVSGSSFGVTQETSLLAYGGSVLGILSWSDTEIQAVLPVPKEPGTYIVQVVVGGLASNIVPHTIAEPPECFVDADCDDGNVCNGIETCVSGICQPGVPLECNDGNVCTDDSCDPIEGCLYHCTATGSEDPCCEDAACAGEQVCEVTEGMALIPAGCFMMGDNLDGMPNALPVHEVCISAFEMDVYEVTNAQYAECVAAGGCTAPLFSLTYTRPSYYGNPSYGDFPVIWVNWHQATDYCMWAGKRLPTEAEWEYAARGGLEGKRYPWGDTITCDDANYGRGNESSPCWNHCHEGMCDNDTHPVGHYAPNGYGLYDMGGNVYEWVNDWYNGTYYQYCVDNGIIDDPPGPASGTFRVLRGGSWLNHTYPLRVFHRSNGSPTTQIDTYGFRCSR